MSDTSLSSPNTAWSNDVRDGSLRKMRLPKGKDCFTRLVGILAWMIDKDGPSISTKHAMALLLQRVVTMQQEKESVVGDLVEVYYRLLPGQRDWSVNSCAQWLLNCLSSPKNEGAVQDIFRDEENVVASMDGVKQEIQACMKQSQEAACSFYTFWSVWDKVGVLFEDTADWNFPSAYPPGVARTGEKKQGQDKENEMDVEIYEENDDNRRDPKHDILILAWMLACLVPTDSPEDPLGPTAALALLLAIAQLTKRKGNNEDETKADIKQEEIPQETKEEGQESHSESPGHSTEPPTKRARHEAVPALDSEDFLPWLVETVQKPRPTTRPSVLGITPPEQDENKGDNQEGKNPLTVDRVRKAIFQLIDGSVQDMVRTATTTMDTPQDFPSLEPNLSPWLQSIKMHMASHGHRSKFDMTPVAVKDNLPSILMYQCRRLTCKRFCDKTHLMNYYLETGNDPALAMRADPSEQKNEEVKEEVKQGPKDPNNNIAETAAASDAAGGGKKKTTAPEVNLKKHMELAMQTNNLAAAMELAVMETKKLEEELKTPASRTVTPPIITETMELTEWTVSILCLEIVKPSRKLKKYLDAASSKGNTQWTDVMFPILNRTLLRLSQEGMVDKPTRTAPVSVVSEPESGLVQINGDVTPDKQLGKAVIALYYHALEAVLFVESSRLNVTSHPQIVLYPVFHRALLACCCWCVTKSIGVTQKLRATPSLQAMQIYSTLQVTDSNPYDFLKVSDSFVRSLTLETAQGKLGSPLIFSLPRTLQKDMKQVEMNVSDSLLWARNAKTQDSLPCHIDSFREKTESGVTLWPPEGLAPTLREEVEDKEKGDDCDDENNESSINYPTEEHEDYAEYRCVNFLIRKIVKLAFFRLEALCRFLNVPPEVPLATQAWVAFRYLVRNHVDVLFDRHIDHWILCCLYGVGKTIKYTPELSFARLIEAYVVVRGPELGDVTCQRIVRHIKIEEDRTDPGNADNIIVLYNRVFVPTMKHHFLGSESLKRCAAELPGQLAALQGTYIGEPSEKLL
jgi:hypothetical protein